MEIEIFIKNICEVYEDIDTSDFNAATDFKDNDEYSSLTGMAITSMIEDTYRIKITGTELRNVHTLDELFQLVLSYK